MMKYFIIFGFMVLCVIRLTFEKALTFEDETISLQEVENEKNDNCVTVESIQDRAKLSPIIFQGLAVYTTPSNLSGTNIEHWTSEGYYGVHFWLISVFKGENFISQHLQIPIRNYTSVYNIHDKKVNVSGFYHPSEEFENGYCWIPIKSQKYYIIFAELIDNELKAFSDQYIGAVIDWTEENERSVWQGMGWDEWSDWAACTKTCGEGVQERWRHCSQSSCYGYNKEKRRCNIFPCDGTLEPLSTDNQKYFYPPHAIWERVADRSSAWHIKTNYYLWLPAKEVAFPVNDFQKNFALLLSIRVDPISQTEGTIFSLRSRREKNTFLSLTLSNENILRLVNSNSNDTQSVIIPAIITDGHWHQLALGIQDDVSVRSYLDCHWVSTDIFQSASLRNTNDADLVIGYLFTGDIEHLILVPDAGAVVQQCSSTKIAYFDKNLPNHSNNYETKITTDLKNSDQFQHKRHHANIKFTATVKPKRELVDSTGLIIDNLQQDNSDDDDYSFEDYADDEKSTSIGDFSTLEWSNWSECSVTCGKGVQSRTLQCRQNTNSKPCLFPKISTETRTCKSKINCKYFQKKKSHRDKKIHKERITEHQIDEDMQEQAKKCNCLNGGDCEPNFDTCFCPLNYTGRFCETRIEKICYPECQNGGTCSSDNKCICPEGYIGNLCQESTSCKMLTNMTCNCENVEFDSNSCVQNTFLCYPCKNDGICVRNKCVCPPGWIGPDCSKAICNPPCRNGMCIKPNECLCIPGKSGSTCEIDECASACLNGGTCFGPNMCLCPENTTGLFCESNICDPPCENAATCAPNNKCLCDEHAIGTRCEQKRCKYKAVLKPFTVGLRRPAKRRHQTECATDQSTCDDVRSVPKYETIYTTQHRTVYECVD